MDGYKLDLPDLPGNFPVTIPGLPGVWMNGESKSLEALGLTDTEAGEIADDLNLTGGLELTDVTDAPAPPDFTVTGGMVSNATAASHRAGTPAMSALEPPTPVVDLKFPSSHAELDKLAKKNEVEFGDDVTTVQDKQAALVVAGVTPEEG